MNVAIHPDRRRQGIARDLIEQLFEETGPSARITLEVRVSNAPAIEMYERFGFKHAGRRRRYPRQRRGRPDHVAGVHRQPGSKRGLAREMRILALETDRRHLRGRRRGRADPLNLVSSQAAFHESYGGVVPEVASRHHLGWSMRSSPRRWIERAPSWRRWTQSPSPRARG